MRRFTSDFQLAATRHAVALGAILHVRSIGDGAVGLP